MHVRILIISFVSQFRFKLGYGCTIGFPTILIPAVQGGNGGEPSEGEFRLTKDEISWLSMFDTDLITVLI